MVWWVGVGVGVGVVVGFGGVGEVWEEVGLGWKWRVKIWFGEVVGDGREGMGWVWWWWSGMGLVSQIFSTVRWCC